MTTTELNRNAYLKFKPFPIRLGELKAKMQTEAFEKGSTIHAVAIDIIKNYYSKKDTTRDIQLQKLMEIAQVRRYNIQHHIYKKKFGNLGVQQRLF